MVSQKNLSHSSLIKSAAPPRRSGRRSPKLSRFFFGRRASWLDEVNATRGGLVGGEGSPEVGTSGIPLRPCERVSMIYPPNLLCIICTHEHSLEQKRNHRTCGPGSAVVDALKQGARVHNVARGKDVHPGSGILAIITTTVLALMI